MSTYFSYNFDNMSRIGLDSANIDQNSIQNVAACNYRTQNFFASDSFMKKPIDLATSQPGILYKNGYGSSNMSNIDDSSNLQIGTIQTHPKARIDLFHRPFLTVPYLGRGSVDSISESQIMQGNQFLNKKSTNALSEKSYVKYHQIPLLPAIQQRINDPSYQLENVAHEGWIRGGIHSRELTRDTGK